MRHRQYGGTQTPQPGLLMLECCSLSLTLGSKQKPDLVTESTSNVAPYSSTPAYGGASHWVLWGIRPLLEGTPPPINKLGLINMVNIIPEPHCILGCWSKRSNEHGMTIAWKATQAAIYIYTYIPLNGNSYPWSFGGQEYWSTPNSIRQKCMLLRSLDPIRSTMG